VVLGAASHRPLRPAIAASASKPFGTPTSVEIHWFVNRALPFRPYRCEPGVTSKPSQRPEPSDCGLPRLSRYSLVCGSHETLRLVRPSGLSRTARPSAVFRRCLPDASGCSSTSRGQKSVRNPFGVLHSPALEVSRTRSHDPHSALTDCGSVSKRCQAPQYPHCTIQNGGANGSSNGSTSRGGPFRRR